MATTTLPPPPMDTALEQSDGRIGAVWARWLQQLASIAGRVQLTSSGPLIAQGNGVPTVGAPNGSLYLRMDGAGPNLYVRENGAWVAK